MFRQVPSGSRRGPGILDFYDEDELVLRQLFPEEAVEYDRPENIIDRMNSQSDGSTVPIQYPFWINPRVAEEEYEEYEEEEEDEEDDEEDELTEDTEEADAYYEEVFGDNGYVNGWPRHFWENAPDASNHREYGAFIRANVDKYFEQFVLTRGQGLSPQYRKLFADRFDQNLSLLRMMWLPQVGMFMHEMYFKEKNYDMEDYEVEETEAHVALVEMDRKFRLKGEEHPNKRINDILTRFFKHQRSKRDTRELVYLITACQDDIQAAWVIAGERQAQEEAMQQERQSNISTTSQTHDIGTQCIVEEDLITFEDDDE